MDKKTPIAIFVYDRPSHARQLFDSLLNCSRLNECSVHIFCDGPKKIEHLPQVQEMRQVAHQFAPLFNGAEIVERDQNLGLAHSIVSGVTDLCQKYGRVIVLEDDFILHPFFLEFMLQSLDRYFDDERVAQVAGFTFPIDVPSSPHAFFLPLTTSWGWATWDRVWRSFSWDINDALTRLFEDVNLRKSFELDGAYPYFDILCQAAKGKVDSWAIRWYWQTFSQSKLTIYPRHSLVWQNGFDKSATHTKGRGNKLQKPLEQFLQEKWITPIHFPDIVQADNISFEKVKNFLQPKSSQSLFAHLKVYLRNMN